MTKMDLPSSEECCGCSACFAACPKKAIAMRPDAEGFLQPNIDADACVKCGKCTEVCPVLHSGDPSKPLAVYAAKAKDDELRRISSSGGVFSLLSRAVLAKGGVVFGAAFEKGTHRVIHKAARNEGELDELRGSKYVQSDMGRTFCEVRDCLQEGKEVLFSGCPCQVAGLRAFLGKDFSNLLCVDVICHGVPSPLAWGIFLDSQAQMNKGLVLSVEARRNCSWRTFEIVSKIKKSDGKFLIRKDPIWYSVFFNELCCRLSCYTCRFRGFRSGADLSLGDFWGIENVLPEEEDKFGVSVVFINTRLGERALNTSTHLMNIKTVTISQASKKNKGVFFDYAPSKHRGTFLQNMKVDNFHRLAHHLTDFPWWFRLLRCMKRCFLG